MPKNFSFKDYLCNLKNTMVASTLLGVFHIIAQVVMVISMLSSGFAAFAFGFFPGIGGLILMVILIPIVSLFIRFWFEMIAVIFSINGNLTDIKQGFFGPCSCDDCDGECDCEMEIEEEQPIKKPAPKKAPAKKGTETKYRKSANVAAKKPAKKK